MLGLRDATTARQDPTMEVLIRGDGVLSLTSYEQVLTEIRHSLLEVDKIAVPGRVGRLQWAIRELSGGQDARVVLAPVKLSDRRPDSTMGVSSTGYVEGLQDLDATPAIPAYFSASTVQRVQRIGGHIERGDIKEVRIISHGATQEAAVVSEGMVSQARRAVFPASQARGSVIGRLAVLGAKNAQKPRGEITLTSRQSLQFVGESQHIAQLRTAWGERVLAGGLLTRNSAGQPIKLELEELEILPPVESVSPWSVLGIVPNLGGSASTSEYLRAARRG